MSAIIPRTGLKEGEKILWFGRPRLLAFLGRLILSSMLIFFGMLLLPSPWIPVGAILLTIGVIIIAYTVVKVRAHAYYITNMRVLEEYTLISRTIKETTLDKITDIVLHQGAFGRLLNYGTLHIHTAGTGFPGIDFRHVKDPVVVRGTLINAKDAYQTK